MGRVDVVRVQDDPRLYPCRLLRAGRYQRETRRAVGRIHLDPAVAVAPWNVIALFEAERFVEREGRLLLGDGDHHELKVADPTSRCAHRRSSSSGRSQIRPVGTAELTGRALPTSAFRG